MLDIIMINYRTPFLVKEFLEAYDICDIQVPHTLTVVDVDPIDALLLEYRGDVSLIHTLSNVGYSGACNLGASFTKGSLLAFFNSDVRIYPQSVEKCVETLLSDPEVGVVGPMQVNEKGVLVHSGIFGTLEKPFIRDWMRRPTAVHRQNEECVSVSGSAYFTTRELWNELYSCEIYRSLYPDVEGAFLPTPHYYEETWYSYHAQAHGKKVMYCGEALMYHGFHKSSPMGTVEKLAPESRRMFREACERHAIAHD